MPVDQNRRERKKQQTHTSLIHHATRLFEAAGFANTTTEQIAEAADVSQRTFFRHFPSKEAVLYGDQAELQDRVREAFESRPVSESILTSVTEAILAMADDFEHNRELTLLQVRLAASDPGVSSHSRAVVQTAWEHELIDCVSRRMAVDPSTDPRPEIIAGAAMSGLRVAMRRWHTNNATDSLPELVRQSLHAVTALGEMTPAGSNARCRS